MRAWITHNPIAAEALLSEVGAAEDGAVLLFLGIVRNQNEGRRVAAMRYDAYEAMANDVLAEIAREAAEILGSDRIAVVHRIGDLAIGEASVGIAVSSPHRDQAYQASRYVIEEIKRRLPVWKEEHYVEGEARWLDGVTPKARAAVREPEND